MRKDLYGISGDYVKKMVIAYEPVWAIGTGKVATPQQAEESIRFIRNLLERMYSKDVAESVRILYGGSIKPNNFFGIIIEESIDGGLVGGASLKEDFAELVEISRRLFR